MIEVRGLTKGFGGPPVLDGVSLDVIPGEVLVVLGRSGTGKSVLLRHLVGLLEPDAGEVRVDGQVVDRMEAAQLRHWRRRCVMVFQQPALLDSLTLVENVSVGLGPHGLRLENEAMQRRAERALECVGVGPSLFGLLASEASFGVRKRVSLARAAALEPQFLLFDEPTTSLDPVATQSVNRLIGTLVRGLGAGAVVVSHDIPGALALGDRLVMLDQGKVVFEGTPQEFRSSGVKSVAEFRACVQEGTP